MFTPFLQKSNKNQLKFNQTSLLLSGSWRLLQSIPENRRGDSFVEASWGRLEGLLGPSWRLDRRLGPSWGVLGPSGAVLKSISKSIKKSMPFKIGF